MHSSAHTTTTVSIRLDGSEEFKYTGDTFTRGKRETAMISHVSVFVHDSNLPEVARIRGAGVSKAGDRLRIDREFEVVFAELPAYIVGELHRQFSNSVQGHYRTQHSDPARKAWKLPAGSSAKFLDS